MGPEWNANGFIAAAVTPFREDYSLDLPALRRYIEWLVDQGTDGLAINVSAGEGEHLYPDERNQVLETVAEAAAGRVPIVAGVAGNFTEEAIRYAREAKERGAAALLVFPPRAFGGRPLPVELPFEFHRAVGDAVELPIILFRRSVALGGAEFSVECIEALAELDWVVGVKDATFDAKKYSDLLAVKRRHKDFVAVYTGNDNFILESYLLGADGALLGLGAAGTRLQVDMFKAAKAGQWDKAFKLNERIAPFADAIFGPPARNYRVRLKEALVMQGVLPNAVVRPPLPEASPEERTRIKEAMRHAGLLAQESA